METSATPVSEFMISPVRTILESKHASDAEQEMTARGVSALAVVDGRGTMIGVVSRTDLLRVGRVRMQNGRRRKTLSLPQAPVRELMTPNVQIVAPDTLMAEAARRMIREHIHRLYVSRDRLPVGVVSTKEMMRAVAEARIAQPIADFMHKSIVMVRSDDPLSLAVDRMAAAHHVGLVVVDDGWPVGSFTQADALGAREAPGADRVDSWMDPRVICLPMATPVFRAAEQALATRARRVIAVDADGMRGILTGTDFARIVMHR